MMFTMVILLSVVVITCVVAVAVIPRFDRRAPADLEIESRPGARRSAEAPTRPAGE